VTPQTRKEDPKVYNVQIVTKKGTSAFVCSTEKDAWQEWTDAITNLSTKERPVGLYLRKYDDVLAFYLPPEVPDKKSPSPVRKLLKPYRPKKYSIRVEEELLTSSGRHDHDYLIELVGNRDPVIHTFDNEADAISQFHQFKEHFRAEKIHHVKIMYLWKDTRLLLQYGNTWYRTWEE
jgi:hypothetical protein